MKRKLMRRIVEAIDSLSEDASVLVSRTYEFMPRLVAAIESLDRGIRIASAPKQRFFKIVIEIECEEPSKGRVLTSKIIQLTGQRAGVYKVEFPCAGVVRDYFAIGEHEDAECTLYLNGTCAVVGGEGGVPPWMLASALRNLRVDAQTICVLHVTDIRGGAHCG
jgi:hypothetical protein